MSSSPSKQPDKIREIFGSIAERYDLLNRVLSLSVDRYWRREMVECLDEGPVLDVACGTGDVMRALCKMGIRPVYGLDFSLPMILEGTKKMDGAGSFIQSDAAMIPVSDSTFRGITCAFGVRNFQDRSKCFQEFRRVMTQGGRLVILEFFPPEDRWYLKPYHFYLRNVLPKIGQWISGSEKAYGYLQSSVESFASRRTVQEELHEAGFEQVEHRDLTMGIATLILADCS